MLVMDSKDSILKPEKTIIVDNEPITLALEGKGPYGEQNSITLSPGGTVILSFPAKVPLERRDSDTILPYPVAILCSPLHLLINENSALFHAELFNPDIESK